MASSSDKRIKTIGSKRKDKEPERSYANKFLSRKHERHFKVVQDKRLLMERKAGLILVFAPQFGEQLENRNWGRLSTYPTLANIAVRHAIRYDPDSINRFLNTEWAGEKCQFALNMEERADFGDVESVLCVPGGQFQRNRNGAVVNIKRADLSPLAKGMSVNIGQVIANEIQVCANTMNNKSPLGHPSLITHLCELAGVNISAPPFERPRKAIDEAYYRQYCRGDEAAQPVPPRRPRRGRGPPQGQASAKPQERHAIRYDPDSINRFLNTEWAGEKCQFALNMEERADFGDVESVLCVPGGQFQRNRNGAVVNIKRADLSPLAKGMSVNIGQVIANEIQVCANTMNNKSPLGHPSLITHLCELAGVNISAPPFERPRKAIDEAYYRQYCRGDEAAQPVPPRRPRRGRGPPQGQASAKPQEVATTEMIIGMYDTPTAHRWTMDEFHNVVAWPKEQAQGSRAGAAEALAMDDEDDEDTLEDEEEEDSDDNMG
ncbi:hypothetical protein LR48_Vigan04g103100 [Vigna angularis]|uniref:Putative plant transposon protein domain-containing protein n=1 Tax=Phaseolus angularis TaxID=3914 RepID=A0A0L9UDK1_PHAAN|nr:hypothetical protein LR48_Vigan04g103100 [Vigna angularis]